MKYKEPRADKRLLLFLIAPFLTTVSVNAGPADPEKQIPAQSRPGAGSTQTSAEPWDATELLRSEQLAKMLSDPAGHKFLILHVGPAYLFRSGHLPGAKHFTPPSQPGALEIFQNEVRNIPQNVEIILYCGCCPWGDCPNIRPAFSALRKLGFTRVRVLYLPRNFKQDWTDKGFPVQRGD